MNQQNLEEIKKITKDFFGKTTFEIEIEFLPPQGLTLPINLKTDDPQILIGEKGQTLIELQYLLKIILKRKISEPFFLDLDIDGYKKKKNEYLKELAQSTADEVALTKKEKSLAPMPAYERRIIHLELADRQDIATESIGQETERKVIIKPYP
jgi:spoIIIJ-associated protein